MNEREKVVSDLVGKIYMAGGFGDFNKAKNAENELLALLQPSGPVGERDRLGPGTGLAVGIMRVRNKGTAVRVIGLHPSVKDGDHGIYLNPPSREPEGMTYATRWDLHLADEHGDITVRKFDPAKDKAIPVWIGAAPPESREREVLEALKELAAHCTLTSKAQVVAHDRALAAIDKAEDDKAE